MQRSFSRPFALAVTAALLAPLAGCATGGGNKAATKYVARDVDTLYNAAKERLDRGQYKVAAALFDEVERQHPYSVWARRAQLMSAFSYYLAREYPDSVKSAQRFLSIHPGNKDAPYALYLVALDYYEQIQDLAGKEMEIGRFYQRRGDWLASVIRFRKVVDDYQTTTHAAEALMRLTESYLALGVPEEAKRAAAVLGVNYPGSKWYERAYQLVTKHNAA